MMFACDHSVQPRGLKVLRFIGIAILGLTLAVLLGLGLGWLIQWLWNVLAVPLFKLPLITYWQAVGLFVLGKLLFGGIGGHGRGFHTGGHGHPWRGQRGPFKEFWDAEGRQAFEKYLDRMKGQPNA